jgi:luciferase family oxidoreductase group 1
VGFLSGRLPLDHQFSGIKAQPEPSAPESPVVWLLGSSDYSALLAAKLGLPFAFADFFGNAGDFGPDIAEMYRKRFQPSATLAEPRFSAAVSVICADTDARAREVASSMQLLIAQIRTGGRRVALLPPEEAVQYIGDSQVGRLIASFSRHYIVGGPDTVRAQLADAAERYGTSDLTIATNCYAFDDRVRSFELVADAMLSPAASQVGTAT